MQIPHCAVTLNDAYFWLYENVNDVLKRFFFYFQITGEGAVVKKALYQVAARLHDNPSRSQHQLLSSPSIYRSGAGLVNPHAGTQVMGVTSLMGPYASYKSDGRSRSSSVKEFAVRLVCPTENVGAVIGKGGGIIKQLRQESGASIKVDSAAAEGDDCIIFVSAKEVWNNSWLSNLLFDC